VRLQVIQRGVILVVVGAAMGLTAAFMLTGLLSSLLYGVEAADPVSLSGAAAILIASGVLAGAIPAWRASRTDPVIVLRQQ
jgi:ABC-type antimicrobial peptide transport system permease subunit